MTDPRAAAVTAAYTAAWPRLLAGLVRHTGSVERAEDCLQDAYLRALEQPALDDPAAWIATAARRGAIDAVRHDQVLLRKAPVLAADHRHAPAADVAEPTTTGDDRLDLLLLADAVPLPAESRLPLALRFVLGVSTEEIADALLVQRSTMGAG